MAGRRFDQIGQLLGELNARQVILASDHDIKPFECGNADLNGFLFEDAKVYQKYRSYITYVVENDDETIAFYCLANDLLQLSPAQDDELEEM